jgi:hypothetical protein
MNEVVGISSILCFFLLHTTVCIKHFVFFPPAYHCLFHGCLSANTESNHISIQLVAMSMQAGTCDPNHLET